MQDQSITDGLLFIVWNSSIRTSVYKENNKSAISAFYRWTRDGENLTDKGIKLRADKDRCYLEL